MSNPQRSIRGVLRRVDWKLTVFGLIGVVVPTCILAMGARPNSPDDYLFIVALGAFRWFPYLLSMYLGTLLFQKGSRKVNALTLGVGAYGILDSAVAFGVLFMPQSSTDVIALATLPFYGIGVIALCGLGAYFVLGAVEALLNWLFFPQPMVTLSKEGDDARQ